MDGYCCEEMQDQLANYDGPIGRWPNSGGWIMAAYCLTPSKKAISKKGRKIHDIRFCPFCGTKLDWRMEASS